MKSWRLLVFALVGLAQLAVPASLIWKREQTLRRGSVWKFRGEAYVGTTLCAEAVYTAMLVPRDEAGPPTAD